MEDLDRTYTKRFDTLKIREQAVTAARSELYDGKAAIIARRTLKNGGYEARRGRLAK